jgi:primosomal protein N' (replication factor Y)
VALPLPLRQAFTYRIPEGWPVPPPGARVRVPFGERALTGIVLPGRAEPGGAPRDLLEVLDEQPVCPDDLLATAEKVAERFFASTGEVLRSALPARLPAAGALRYRLTEKGALARVSGLEAEILERLREGGSARVADLPGEPGPRRELLRKLEEAGLVRAGASELARRRRVELAYSRARPGEGAGAELPKSRKARDVLDLLEALGRPASAGEIRARTGASTAILKNLVVRGLVHAFEEQTSGRIAELSPAAPVVLTPEQRAAAEAIASAVRDRRYFPALLAGVTGSGKTEVYLAAIAAALAAGRTAVWLVPEIALTPVFARRLTRAFGERAAVLHSSMSQRERADAWDRVRSGSARAVIGPRSAAFAPVVDAGLFVVDEEHDPSYKQRESPRYDAREVVAIRARSASAALVFGSATPSIEAEYAARRGRLTRLSLTQRVDGRPLPSVTLVDLRREPALPEEKGVPLFSRPLDDRLSEVFARGEQAILLQPRRGYAPFLLCRDCGYDFRCSRCSVARTVHDRGRALLCHYCGERRPLPTRCPECSGAVLEAIGAGTERVAEKFAARFPGVAHAVLDRDAARRRGVEAVVEDVLSGRVQCLIGTQMVAKGHDFPGVTAVGVLSADAILNFPDFRSAEKTFQLVAQVAGRAGRGSSPGTVHVQTFHPDHPAIRRAAVHDTAGFAEEELTFRRSFFYPPFSELAAITVSSTARERAEAEAARIGEKARTAGAGLRLSGPAPAPLERLQGQWRFQLLLRGSDRRGLLGALEACAPSRPPAGVRVAVDVDPQDLM